MAKQVVYTKDSIDEMQNILSSMNSDIQTVENFRNTYESIDKYIERETDRTTDTKKGHAARKQGNKVINNTEIGVVKIYTEVAATYLAGTFLTGYPIFAAVADREHEDVAAMMTSLCGRDQRKFKWVANLIRCHSDVLKYNVCFARPHWKALRTSIVQTQLTTGSSTTAAAPSIIYEGNALDRLDPYNTFYDTGVEPHEVHEKGSYAGWHEQVNYIRLKELYHVWDSKYTIKQNIRDIFSGKAGRQYKNHYHVPNIRSTGERQNSTNSWSHYFGNNPRIALDSGNSGIFEITYMYKKVIPREYKIPVATSPGDPHLFFFIWVNGNLAYAEPISQGHQYLPIICGQLRPGATSLKSFAEDLEDIQDLSTGLLSATLGSMRRAVHDRALYDPNRIRKQDVEGDHAAGKIPVAVNSYDGDLGSAYKAIPYEDRISQNFDKYLGYADMLAQRISGQNLAAQGNFIKGNKTMDEFDTIMNRSDARMQMQAMNLNEFFYSPIKEIFAFNYLFYATDEQITDRVTQESVNVDVAQLRKIAPEFKMADGLMPSTKLGNTQILAQASQIFAQNPELHIEYNLGAMLTSIIKQEGFTDLRSYQRTPEEQQAYLEKLGVFNGQSSNRRGSPADNAADGQTPPQQ